jgi:hypothetical protein
MTAHPGLSPASGRRPPGIQARIDVRHVGGKLAAEESMVVACARPQVLACRFRLYTCIISEVDISTVA